MNFFKPNVSEDFAIDLMKRLYGLEVLSIGKLVSYDDQNFHILVSSNYNNPYIHNEVENGYTLKITNPHKSAFPGYFDSMHAIMYHQTKKGLHTPLPVKNINGHNWSLENVPLLIEDENTPGPKLCGVHVLQYISGHPISTVNCTKDIFFQWGSLLAKYHIAAKDFTHPSLKDKNVLWSLENIPILKKYMHVLQDDKKVLINSVLNRFPVEIESVLHQLPKGCIHGDFNENNVLVQTELTDSGEKTYSVDGILDFEDMHIGTYVWDIGVMMAYCIIVCNETTDIVEASGYALAGYLSARSINDLEHSLLKMCIECRLCQSLVMGAYTSQQDPNNAYLLDSAKTGWTKLKNLCSLTNEDVQMKWKTIQLSC